MQMQKFWKNERAYDAIVEEGDDAFKTQNFDVVLERFTTAFAQRPSDDYVERRIKETNEKIAALKTQKA